MASTSRKSSIKLLDSNSDSETEDSKPELSFNTDYAKRYDRWRGQEELQKLKDRYGDNPDPAYESSESETTSEEEWTPQDEKSFLTALSSLKGKDPKIYDNSRQFFNKHDKTDQETQINAAGSSIKKKKGKEKPFLIKDHEREMILQNRIEVDSDEETEQPHSPSYYEQQNEIKKSLKSALQGQELDLDDDDNSNLLKKRIKTEKEVEHEEEDYRKWLKGELGKLDEKGKEEELKFLRDYWNDPKLDEGEQFLRDYILQRKYVEESETAATDQQHIPSYDEIVHDSDEGGLSGDEKQLEEMEKFENKFNFRFEEPDPEFIKKYPRTIEESYRRKESKRKQDRENAKKRKEEEKERKIAEIQQLKALKRKEIVDKIEQLQEVSGDPDLPVVDLDLEGDFNPEDYDRRMKTIFSSDFYEEADAAKPVFPYDEEIDDELQDIEEWLPAEDEDEPVPSENSEEPKKRKKKTEARNTADENEGTSEKVTGLMSKASVMQSELLELSKGKRMGKKKSIFLEALEKKKPKFDPSVHKSFEKYFNEYYKLDFEDLVGDIPCRFKYRNVVPNDFGLTTDEILQAEDKELNQWASLKKTYQYRSTEEETYEVQAYTKKASNPNVKKKILTSFYSETKPVDEAEANQSNDDDESTNKTKKKKKKRKRKKSATATATDDNAEMEINPNVDVTASLCNLSSETTEIPTKKHKKKKPKDTNGISEKGNSKSAKSANKVVKRKNTTAEPIIPVPEDRLRAYGINPSKYAKRKKYAK